MTLRALLRWAAHQYQMETPNLEHSVGQTDEGGSPDMRSAAKAYLALSGSRKGADNWRDLSCRVDQEGKYLTPLRCALYSITNPELRVLARDAIAGYFDASQLATLHGIPEYALNPALFHALATLDANYCEQRPYRPGWVSQSEANRNAVMDGEKVSDGAIVG